MKMKIFPDATSVEVTIYAGSEPRRFAHCRDVEYDPDTWLLKFTTFYSEETRVWLVSTTDFTVSVSYSEPHTIET